MDEIANTMKIPKRHSKQPFVACRSAKSSALRDLVHYLKQIDAQAVAWLAGRAEKHRLRNLDRLIVHNPEAYAMTQVRRAYRSGSSLFKLLQRVNGPVIWAAAKATHMFTTGHFL